MLMDDFAALLLQVEWGADEALEMAPVARLRPAEARRGEAGWAAEPRPGSPVMPLPVTASSLAPTPATVPGDTARPRGTPVERATAAANGAATLEELRAAIAGFEECALRDVATHLVFAEGDASAPVLLIGEPPGRDEDRSGHPFAGAEGQLLDEMLNSIGLRRAELMLVHLLPWRPPGGRPPNPTELALCLPFLHRLIVLLAPRRLLLLGGTVRRALLPAAAARRRGGRGWTDVEVPGLAAGMPALGLPSLAEVLKTPVLKRDAWAGLRLLRHALDADRAGN